MKLSLAAGLLAVVGMAATGASAQAQGAQTCDVEATGLPVVAKVGGSISSVGFMVGVRWGEGVLTMLETGEQRRFDILGAKLAETGAAKVEFEGEVYNLNNIEDFVGTYYGAGTGITIAKGAGEAVVNNARCVVVKVKTDRAGLQASAPAPGGVEISWD